MQIRYNKQIQGISNEIVPTENECKKIKLKNCTMGNITFVGRFCVNLVDVQMVTSSTSGGPSTISG